MSESGHTPPMFDAADEEVTRYRALSSLAVAGLLAGLLSPLAMFASLLWLLPLVAVVLSGVALRRIASRWPALAGRPAALAGLMLGAVFLVAAPVDDAVYRCLVRRQARQFAEIWIDAVRQGDKYKVHHLMLDPKRRLPPETNLPDYYSRNVKWQKMLKELDKDQTLQTLFALGMTAEIRFYKTAAEGRLGLADVVWQTYAVTYPDEQERPKSFFITLQMQRSVDTSSGRAEWTMAHVDSGVRPPGQ